jgi:DNA-binding response OmpR family regulator
VPRACAGFFGGFVTDWQARAEELEARVAGLEQQIGLALQPPTVFDLTRKETAILGVLLANRHPRRETFMVALYSDRPNPPHSKIIDVYISHLRRKLAPLGIQIDTRFGEGFEIPEESKARARRLMDAA